MSTKHGLSEAVVRTIIDQIVKPLCRRLSSSHFSEFPDMVQDGVVGVLQAAQSFDPSRGVSFEAYLRKRVRGEILNGQGSGRGHKRRARSEVRRLLFWDEQLTHSLGRRPTEMELAVALGVRLARLRRLQWLHNMALTPTVAVVEEVLGEHPQGQWIETCAIREALREVPERSRQVLVLHYFYQLEFKLIACRLRLSVTRVCQLHRSGLCRLRRGFRD